MAEVSSSGSGSPVASAASPTPAGGAATDARQRGRASSLLRAIQFASVVVVVLLAALAGYYYFYATRQQEYLAARNVRALVTMSSQVQGTLFAADQVLSNLDVSGNSANLGTIFKDLAVRGIPSLQRGPCTERAKSVEATGEQPTKWAPDTVDATCLGRTFGYEGNTRLGFALLSSRVFNWIVADPVERRIAASAMIVDTTGIVLLQSGAPELGIRRLDQLVLNGIVRPKVKDTPPPAPTWLGIRSNASRVPVLISGQQYDLFVQPCCHRATGIIDRGLVVAALVRSSSMQRESLQISYSLVALIVAVLVLVATTMPFLKLHLVGPLQRIRSTDVLLLAFCSILCASLTTVVALDVYAYAKLRRELDQQLVQLADAVASHLGRELRLVHGELKKLVTWQDTARSSQASSVLLPNLLRDRGDREFAYPFFESWTMVDSVGMQQKKWSFDKVTTKPVKVGAREYFRAARAGGSWSVGRLATSTDAAAATRDSSMFAFESIQSWTTGKRQAILAIPTGQPTLPVAAMTVDLASVIDPVIAPNFIFAVVDSTGLVLFHSDKRRNLQENLFAETDPSRAIRSAVFARTSVSVGVKYGGDDRHAYVRPIPGLPWSVVTFRDENALRVTNLETVATTVYLVVLYAMLMVILGLAHLKARRERRLAWFWPDRTRGEEYIRLAGTYVVLLLAFVLALMSLRDSALLSASALLPLYAALLTWAVLRISPLERRRGTTGTWRRQRQWPLVIVAIVLLTVTTIAGGDKISVTVLLFLVVIATAIALGPSAAVAHRLEPWVHRWPVSRRYLLGVTLLLLLICVLPAMGFFQVAHRVHTQSFVRHGQLRIAMALDARRRRIEQTYNDTTGYKKSVLLAPRLCYENTRITGTPQATCGLDIYSNIFFDTKAETVPGSGFSDKNYMGEGEWLGMLGQPYDAESSVERRPLFHLVADDDSWRSAVSQADAWLTYQPLGSASTIYLHSLLPALTPPSGADIAWILLMILALPALSWGTAAFVSRRLFLLDLLDARPFGELTIRERTGRNFIVVCRNNQELAAWTVRADFLDVNVERAGEPVCVILPGVSASNAEEQAIHDKRLAALERLVLAQHAVVVVVLPRIGAQSPLRDRLELLGHPQRSTADRERLERLMERFVVIDASRTSGAADAPVPNSITASPSEIARSALIAEQSGDPELRKLWSDFETDFADGSMHAESYGTRTEVLDRLGERAEPYYDSIWATCSRSERVVMVHLAEDGFANSKDHEILRGLLTRGLVRRTPRIALLNETFRRFVMRRGSAEEAIAERTRELSVWDGIRLPILMLLAVVLTFFLVTQQEFFNSVTAVAAGLVTGLPVFVRLASWVSDRQRVA